MNNLKGESSEGKGEKDDSPKKMEKRNRIRLCPQEVLSAFFQAKLTVTTETSGLVVTEPLVYVRTQLRLTNGVAEVKPNQPFRMFMSKFSRTPRRLPKIMVVGMAMKTALQITELTEKMGRNFARCQNISGASLRNNDGVKGEVSMKKGDMSTV